MNKNRKGFTIVELVIVIAIIAILAAVLIPTFASLIAKANVSVDTQLVRNLNNALAQEKAGGENNKTMYDALMMTKSAGYDIDTIVSKSGNNIAWDSKNDRFVLIDPNNDTYIYPTENGAGSQTIANPVDFFVIYNEVPTAQKYSIYLSKNATVTEANVTVGFDAGENTAVSTVNYKNTSAQTVIIRTNGGTLNIDAPSDVVLHYSDVDKVVIKQIADASYHENGKVAVSMEVKDGHVVIEPDAVVKEVVVPTDASADTKVDVKGNSTVNTLVVDSATAVVEVKENAKVENVVAADGNTNVTVPESVGATKSEKTEVGTAEELINAISNSSVKYILLTANIDVKNRITIDRDLIIDGSSNKYAISASGENVKDGRTVNVGNTAKAVNATLKNLKIVGPTSGAGTRGLIIWEANVTIGVYNCDISSNNYAINITGNAAKLKLDIHDSNVMGWAALNIWAFNNEININNSTLVGTNDKGESNWNNFATICFEADTTCETNEFGYNNKVTIMNSTVKAVETNSNIQSVVAFNGGNVGATHCIIEFSDCVIETNRYKCTNGGQGNTLIINGEQYNGADLSKLSFDFENVSFAENNTSATGIVRITYDGTQYSMDLANVSSSAWSRGTDYFFDVDLGNIVLSLDIDVSSDYGEDQLCVYLSEYIK